MMKAYAFLATFAVAATGAALAAPVDPHAGHHPAEAAAAPKAPATPTADTTSMPHKCPMMDDKTKPMPSDKPAPSPGGSTPMMMDGKPMAHDMMEKCMKPEPARATSAADSHKHE